MIIVAKFIGLDATVKQNEIELGPEACFVR